MKRISRLVVLTFFSLLVLGGTRSFANPQQQTGGTNNDQNIIRQLLNDIFGDGSKSGSGNNNSGTSTGQPGTGGGGTAPIDGGISLLLAAGVGLGMKKMGRRKES